MSTYHYYELYNPNNIYIKEKFEADYGHGLLNYIYVSIKINNIYYVVVEEELSRQELYKLIPYCNCEYCCKHWLNPMKYLISPSCIGCLRSSFPSQNCINLARERYLKNESDILKY